MESTSVVCRRLAFAEVIGLDLRRVCTKPLPVNLVKVVRLHDEAADNACAWSCLECYRDLAKHYIPLRGKLRSVAGLPHGEGYAIGIVGRVSIGAETVGSSFREIDVDRFPEGGVWRASTLGERIAIAICLSFRRYGLEQYARSSSEAPYEVSHLRSVQRVR